MNFFRKVEAVNPYNNHVKSNNASGKEKNEKMNQNMNQKKSGPKVALICAAVLGSLILQPSSLRAQAKVEKVEQEHGVNHGVDHGVDLKTLDRAVKPDVDFYRFANGGWIDRTPLPADRPSIGAFEEVSVRNEAVLHTILERAAKQSQQGASNRESKSNAGVSREILNKVGLFYRVGMDESLADRVGVEPLRPILREIDGVKDSGGLVQELARLHRVGISAGFEAGVAPDPKNSRQMIWQFGQGGLGLPERDYYLNADPRSTAIRKHYADYIVKSLTLLGESTEVATTAATDIVALETRLAKSSLAPVQMRDPNALYHRTTLAELKALTPGTAWDRYFTEADLPNPGDMNVGVPDFLKAFDTALAEVPLAQWKSYLRWHTISSLAPFLSRPFVEESFRFGTLFSGQKEQSPRWRRVLRVTDGALGEALGQLFVAEAFPVAAKRRALALVLNLKGALRERIQKLDWMGDETKSQALHKLDTLQIKVGYPDKWLDYGPLKVESDSFVQNVLRANEFDFHRAIAKVGKPVDRAEWGMTPPTVNAYYNPMFNEIVFPAGILQPPFFDPKADDASNYGAIGMVIGHEMTHGFDDQGRQFDADGNLKDWWTAEDAQRFAERGQALVKQYGAYKAVELAKTDAKPETKSETVLVNGQLTLGENISDLGGLTVAYEAWKQTPQGRQKATKALDKDSFAPRQRFFLAFAQIWRSKMSPEMARMLASLDAHSPNRWRVLGTLVNMPSFVEAFGPGDTGSVAQPGSGSVKIW